MLLIFLVCMLKFENLSYSLFWPKEYFKAKNDIFLTFMLFNFLVERYNAQRCVLPVSFPLDLLALWQ